MFVEQTWSNLVLYVLEMILMTSLPVHCRVLKEILSLVLLVHRVHQDLLVLVMKAVQETQDHQDLPGHLVHPRYLALTGRVSPKKKSKLKYLI